MTNSGHSGAGEGDRTNFFSRGQMVLVTLNAPREKFWGVLLELVPAGISVRGIDLNSLEDFARQVKLGEPVSPGAVFFPMHRVERIELDARNGDIPSLSERFLWKTGRQFSEFVAGENGGVTERAATEAGS